NGIPRRAWNKQARLRTIKSRVNNFSVGSQGKREMSTADSRGPVVGDAEMLLRFITSPDWWRETGPTSAAFKSSPFSVNVESLTTIEESTRQLHSDLKRPNGGIVRFNCGASRQIGFDTRL